jgi:hypothetical protein
MQRLSRRNARPQDVNLGGGHSEVRDLAVDLLLRERILLPERACSSCKFPSRLST